MSYIKHHSGNCPFCGAELKHNGCEYCGSSDNRITEYLKEYFDNNIQEQQPEVIRHTWPERSRCNCNENNSQTTDIITSILPIISHNPIMF